ncbi:MAG: PAS domain S-box protein [Spirochaetes bacterium]|nr:PAS domain S-box protein [Spirochaetota bacterium]
MRRAGAMKDSPSNARIMIVEDDRLTALDIRNALRRIGYQVYDPLASGAEAVEKAAALDPDLIIADITLEGEMNGIEAVRQIKKMMDIPVIYFTAYSSPEMFRRALETHPHGYLVKPVGTDDLYTTIETALQRSGLERKLRDSESRYRTLVEISPDGIALTDLDLNFLMANRKFLTMYGFESFDDLKSSGATAYTLFSEEERDRAMQNLRSNLDADSQQTSEYKSMRRDGTVFPIDLTLTVVRDESDQPKYLLGIVRDISKRKMLEENLQWELSSNASLADLSEFIIRPGIAIEEISEQVLQHARTLTGSDHGYAGIIDLKTGELVCHTLSRMMERECGIKNENERIAFPRGEDGRYGGLWGHSLNTLKPFFTNSPGGHQALMRVPSGHVPLKNFLSVPAVVGETLLGQIALANTRHDYTDRDLETVRRIADLYALTIQRQNYERALQEANELLEQRVRERTAKLRSEIEERKRVEQMLREGEEVARGLINSPSEPVFLVSTDGTVIDLNAELEKRMELAKAEIIGTSMFDYIREDQAAGYRQKMDAVASSGKAVRFEHQIGRNWFDTIMYPVTDYRGIVTKLAVFSHDITETRRLQKEIMEISELERKRIGQDLHDGLGQKLTGIGFLAEALKRSMHEKNYPELADIEEISANIAESIDDARKISRGLWTTRIESYDARRALLELAEDTEDLFGITCSLESDLSGPIVDSAIVTNLYFITRESINNAIKHGKADRIDVRLSDDPESLFLEIQDNGMGAAATFDEGKGIGLRIMRYRAGIIGGTCTFDAAGKGFTVRVAIRKESFGR